MTFFRRLTPIWLASVSLLPANAIAQAPTGNAAPTVSGGLENIVVTARRREENLQSTPVAVTALNADALVSAQVEDASDLQRLAPSSTVTTGSPGAAGFTYVSIRGAGNLQPGVANDPAVGIYVDGVYIARPSQGLTDLNDIERIEVLRGPQGTLFGRNTTGGAFNVISANPTGEFATKLKAQVGNFDHRNLNVVVNAPIKGEELAARLVYDFNEHDGYGRNLTLDREVANTDSHFVRGKLRYAPSDSDWSVVVAGDYNTIKDTGQDQVFVGFDPALAQLMGFFGETTDLNQFLHTRDRWYDTYGTGLTGNRSGVGMAIRQPQDTLEAYGFSATVDGQLAGLNFKSISAYRYSFANGIADLDSTPVEIISNESGYKSEAWSQELQLSGTAGERFDYITGLYYSHETGNEYSDARVLGFIPTQRIFRNDGDVTNDSAGAFAQGYYRLSDKVRLAAGLRWTWDTREVVIKNILDISQPANAAGNCLSAENDVAGICAHTQKVHFDYPAYTLGLDYQLNDDIFLYAKTSRASKAGGFNLRQGSLPAFKPERLDDVEIGAKTGWLDNRLRLNTALFYSWQREVQRNAAAFVNGNSTQFLRNAGDARVYGVEFEINAAPWEGMLLTGNLSLMDGEYKDGTFLDLQTIGGIPGCSGGEPVGTYNCTVDRSAELLPQLPKRQVNIGATQKVPTGFGEVAVHLDYSYIGSHSFGDVTPAAAQPQSVKDAYATTNRLNIVPGYGLVNGRISLQLDHPNVEVALFGRNLTDKKYIVHTFADLYITALGYAIHYVGTPRIYGLEATYHFGQ